MKVWYWTNYWMRVAGERKRRIRDLETAIRTILAGLETGTTTSYRKAVETCVRNLHR